MNSMTVATPVIDDVDSDGTLDLILVTAGIIKRFALNHHPAAKPLWNQFRGPDENGFLRPGS